MAIKFKFNPLSGKFDMVDEAGTVVSSFNGLTGDVTLAAGTNIVLTPVGNTITITAQNDATAVWGSITGTLSAQTDLQTALDAKLSSATAATTYEPLKGADDNYVTDAQLVVIGNTSGTNTGDQTLPTRDSLGVDTDDTVTFAGVLLSGLTASQIVITDASKNLVSAAVATYPSLTELTYLKGVTSGIQAQIDGLAAAGVSDGDKGDITVSSSGTVWTIDADVVTYAKIQNVSATSRILGRITALAGDIEELTAANVFTILGITSSAAELNITDGVTATATELNYLDITTLGTGAASKAVVLDAGDDYTWPATGVLTYGGTGITATGAEINILDGATLTVTELNYVDGVTSAIQTQLDGKLANVSEDTSPTLGGALDAGGFDINNGGVIFLTEQADAEADVAGKGQIWVNTATPNELWFTDDAGTDFQLGTFTGTLLTKLNGIEALADVTDATNVTAAGALMDSEVTNLSGIKTLTVPDNTTITAAAATVLDDTTVGAMVDTLGGATSTGTGGIARATSPTFVTPALGTPASGVATNITGLVPANIVTGTLAARINLGEGADTATIGLEIDHTLSADERYSGITTPGTAGATIAFGDICYLDVTAGEWLLADASAVGTAGNVPLGICVDASTDGAATSMLLIGTVRSAAFPGSVALGAPLYVSETAGDITATAPTTTDSVMRRVGWAITVEPNTVYFNPSNDYVTHT